MNTGILTAIISGVALVIIIECVLLYKGKKEKKTSGSAAETAKLAKKSKSIKIGCYEHKRSRLEKDGRRIKDGQMGKVIDLKDRKRERKISSVKVSVQEEIKKVSPINKQWWM